VIDVLRGKTTEKVLQHRHDSLSVFGIGLDLEATVWRSVMRQLIVQGYLRADAERFGALVLAEKSRPLLRGETVVLLRRDVALSAPVKKPCAVRIAVPDGDRDFWEALRGCRQLLASEHKVPPYVIFHDATLLQIMARRPRDAGELLDISGVGQAKLQRYGEAFLNVIREYA